MNWLMMATADCDWLACTALPSLLGFWPLLVMATVWLRCWPRLLTWKLAVPGWLRFVRWLPSRIDSWLCLVGPLRAAGWCEINWCDGWRLWQQPKWNSFWWVFLNFNQDFKRISSSKTFRNATCCRIIHSRPTQISSFLNPIPQDNIRCARFRLVLRYFTIGRSLVLLHISRSLVMTKYQVDRNTKRLTAECVRAQDHDIFGNFFFIFSA